MIFAFRYANNPTDYFVLTLFTVVSVCIAMVLHEVAHGLVAKWNGDNTAKNLGRLSLNPLKHFDPIGFVMLMTVGFGYAKPVPVNPYNFKNRTRGMVTVALAGIITNLILAFVSAFFVRLFSFLSTQALLSGSSDVLPIVFVYAVYFFMILMTINLSLVFFNLLPIYPLDGFKVVESFTKYGNKFCEFMRTNGQYILYGLVALSFVVSSAMSEVPTLPFWFEYIDILGTYLEFFVGIVSWLFSSFWSLIIPMASTPVIVS